MAPLFLPCHSLPAFFHARVAWPLFLSLFQLNDSESHVQMSEDGNLMIELQNLTSEDSNLTCYVDRLYDSGRIESNCSLLY